MTVFSAPFNSVAITVAQDLFEIVAPASSRVRLLEVDLTQFSDPGDAEAEILSLLFIRGHTVSGSGGSTVTPVNLDPNGPPAGTTVEINNTTLAITSGTTIWATSWNLQGGFIWRPAYNTDNRSFDRNIVIDQSQRLVIRILAPADSITANCSILFEEIGAPSL